MVAAGFCRSPLARASPGKTACLGTTLLELMVVVSFAAVILAIGIPSFTSFLASIRMSTTASQLKSDFILARTEAIKRNANVLVCGKSANVLSCASVTDWSAGWLICVDGDGSGQCDSAGDALIASRAPIDLSLRLISTRSSVTMNSLGNAPAMATLTLSNTRNLSLTKTLAVALSGNVSSS